MIHYQCSVCYLCEVVSSFLCHGRLPQKIYQCRLCLKRQSNINSKSPSFFLQMKSSKSEREKQEYVSRTRNRSRKKGKKERKKKKGGKWPYVDKTAFQEDTSRRSLAN